jgi:hypothetical protein
MERPNSLVEEVRPLKTETPEDHPGDANDHYHPIRMQKKVLHEPRGAVKLKSSPRCDKSLYVPAARKC